MQLVRQALTRLEELGRTKLDALRANTVISNWAVCRGESAHANPYNKYSPEQTRAMLADYFASDVADEMSSVSHMFRGEQQLFDDGLTIVLAGIEQVILSPPSRGRERLGDDKVSSRLSI